MVYVGFLGVIFVKFLKTTQYNDLFLVNPTWITESIAGIGLDGRALVTMQKLNL